MTKKSPKKPTKKSPKKSTTRAAKKSALAAPSSEPLSKSDASVAVVRAWLADAYFTEDPTGESPERIEIAGPGWDGVRREHYVDVRVYVPQIDIESEIVNSRGETPA